MSSNISPDADRVLNFWFDDQKPTMRWFTKDDAFDNEIMTNFGDLIVKARTPELDSWTDNSKGTLALLILLDQFSRNVYRGTPDAFAADPKALDLAVKGIVKGFDKEVTLMQQGFFYLPMMHSETLLGQIASREHYQGFALRCQDDPQAKELAELSVKITQRHMDIISKFGRFPGRNAALARESTTEEIEFLKEFPEGM